MLQVRCIYNAGKADKTKLIPSDHFPLVIRLKNLPTRRIKRKQVSTWNLCKVDGWKVFKELQSKVKEKEKNNIMADQTPTIDEVDKKVENIQTKIKFQSFGKTKPMTENAKKHRMERRHKPFQGMEDKKGN